jgi:hypothetical protein
MATFADLYNAIPGPYGYDPLAPSPAASPMNFGGLLFGGMDGGLNEYLTDAQRQAMQRQAMLSAAAALLKSSGRSTTPVSIGQALGQGLEAGAAGYQQAQQGAIAQLMTKQKLDEAKRAQQIQENYQRMIYGQPTEGQAITPEQAISAPGMALGPTQERAAMIGQPAPSVMPSGMNVLSPMQRVMLSNLPAAQGIPEILKLTQPSDKAKLLERQAVVAWLREQALQSRPDAAGWFALNHASVMIERGEHRREEKE